MCDLLKNMSLYREGDDKVSAIHHFNTMSKAEVEAHMSKLKSRRNQEVVRENGPHEESWWYDTKHPERLEMLVDIVGERMKEDSENGKGEKLYIKERCYLYERYQRDIEQQKREHD